MKASRLRDTAAAALKQGDEEAAPVLNSLDSRLGSFYKLEVPFWGVPIMRIMLGPSPHLGKLLLPILCKSRFRASNGPRDDINPKP